MNIWTNIRETDQYIERKCDICKKPYVWDKRKHNAIYIKQKIRSVGFTCTACAIKQAKTSTGKHIKQD